MGHVLLGHGELDVRDGGNYPAGMGVVALDKQTTLQVYTDSGQGLMVSNQVFEVFSRLQAPWDPMDWTNVTWNLTLIADEDDLALERNEPGFFARVFAPHTPVLAGTARLRSPALLCTGDPTKCPTDPRMVSGDLPGPRSHTCGGILGTFKGELLWVACTVVKTDDQADADAVAAARGTAPTSALLGTNPDDASGAWYVMERDYPAQLEAWFDEQSEQTKAQLCTDTHIRDWYFGTALDPDDEVSEDAVPDDELLDDDV